MPFRMGMAWSGRQLAILLKNIRRLRGTGRYKRLRKRILTAEPLCRPCRKAGLTMGAQELDHIVPAHKAPKRFWDRSNLQPICRACHEKKSSEERREGETLQQRAWKKRLARW